MITRGYRTMKLRCEQQTVFCLRRNSFSTHDKQQRLNRLCSPLPHVAHCVPRCFWSPDCLLGRWSKFSTAHITDNCNGLSLCVSLPLSAALSVSVSLSASPCLYLSVSQSFSLCASLCVSLSLSLSVSLSLSLSLSVCLSVCLSVSLSLSLPLSLCLCLSLSLCLSLCLVSVERPL